jgi:hypothetical protein
MRAGMRQYRCGFSCTYQSFQQNRAAASGFLVFGRRR